MELVFSVNENNMLKKWVKSQESAKIGAKSTVVCLQLENGYEVLGSSGCVNPLDYNKELGEYYATLDALEKLKDIVGYVAQEEFLN